MGVFFTSDTHFQHKNLLQWEDRPYSSIEEMNESLIDSWNSQVTDSDIVYHLGDFALTNYENTVDIIRRLKGKIVLIKGNHDFSNTFKKISRLNLLHEYHELGTTIKYFGHKMFLTHYPMEIGNRPYTWSIHGHIHSNKSTWLNQINVGVDSPQFNLSYFGKLVTLEELYDIMHERNPYLVYYKQKQREKS